MTLEVSWSSGPKKNPVPLKKIFLPSRKQTHQKFLACFAILKSDEHLAWTCKAARLALKWWTWKMVDACLKMHTLPLLTQQTTPSRPARATSSSAATGLNARCTGAELNACATPTALHRTAPRPCVERMVKPTRLSVNSNCLFVACRPISASPIAGRAEVCNLLLIHSPEPSRSSLVSEGLIWEPRKNYEQ